MYVSAKDLGLISCRGWVFQQMLMSVHESDGKQIASVKDTIKMV